MLAAAETVRGGETAFFAIVGGGFVIGDLALLADVAAVLVELLGVEIF